jgi:hypothetical protein
LERLLVGDQAGVIATAAHDCRRRGSRNGLREGRGASAVVVLGLAGRDITTVDGGVGVTTVGVQITADLGTGCGRQ